MSWIGFSGSMVVELHHRHESHREIERARLGILGTWVFAVGERLHQQDPVPVGSAPVDDGVDQRPTDATPAIPRACTANHEISGVVG